MADHKSHLDQLGDIKQGHYSDGHPLDDAHYLECKVILKDRFTSKQSFQTFCDLARRAAAKAEVDLSTTHLTGQRPEIREVVFLDTADFRLYNNAFNGNPPQNHE